jgi:integrase
MLDDAVEDLLLGVNPAAGVSAPGRPRRKVTDLTPEQVGLLLEHAGEDRALLLVLAGLGLRRSEASGLQAGDVDFLHRTVHVRRQRHPGGRVDAPKSSAGLREIPAVPDVLTALAAHMEARGLHVDDRDATCSTTRRRSPVGSRGSPAARRSPPPPTPYATTSAPASSAAG